HTPTYDMLSVIKGHAAIVTGCASGLGSATASELARAGARVACLDVNLDGARAVAEKIGGQALHCDVTHAEQAAAALRQARDKHGAARLVVKFAGGGAAQRIVGRDRAVPLARLARVLDLHPIRTLHILP